MKKFAIGTLKFVGVVAATAVVVVAGEKTGATNAIIDWIKK